MNATTSTTKQINNRCCGNIVSYEHKSENKEKLKFYNKDVSKRMSIPRLITISFLCLISVGTLLLMLPISTVSGQSTNFLGALFTATSASCVTGLAVYETASHFTLFGQIVIIILIQIGGLGVITITTLFIMLLGKKITIKQREIIQNSLAAPKVGGIVKLLRFLIKRVFIIEVLGGLLMMIVLIKDYSLIGIYKSLFTSISAFCNAGFDVFGEGGNFVSLMNYYSNPIIMSVISLLIIIGGLGFLTWGDIHEYKLKFRLYSTQSKVVICTTLILLLGGFVYFFLFEFNDLTMNERFYYSLFQSVTTRTAGFTNFDQSTLSDDGKLISIILMLIGGAPGSTAGGMKVVCFASIVLLVLNQFKKENEIIVFGRTIDDETLKTAVSIFFIYLSLFITAGLILSRIDDLPLMDCLYETASAIGTVGLSVGITSGLCNVSKLILILLMFIGRIGGLTLIFASSNRNTPIKKYPKEKLFL